MQMNEHKYMWNHAGTALLISIWADCSIQKQLRSTVRNQPIWDGVARYMMRKGYRVNGKQCRTRIKNILVRYRDVKKTGNFNGSGIEPFYNDVDRVMTARNKHVPADKSASSPDMPSTDPLGLAEQNYSCQGPKENADEEVIRVNIKSEQNSPPTVSDYSMQELQDHSQDSSHPQQCFQTADVALDDDQSSSSFPVTPSPTCLSPSSLVQSGDGPVACCDGKMHGQENGYSSLQCGSLHCDFHPSDEARIINPSSRRDIMPPMERLVMRAIHAQSEAITKVLSAQSKLFMHMVKVDRERQARLESKLDCLLERLDKRVSCVSESTASQSTAHTEQDALVNRLLDRLDWAIPAPLLKTAASRQLEISNRNQEAKVDILLEKLDKLLPILNPQMLKGLQNTQCQPE